LTGPELSRRLSGPLAAVALLLATAPVAAAVSDPVDHSQPAARDGTAVCADWVHGRRATGGLLQRVSRRTLVRQGAECRGVENAFVIERPTDGGLFRAGRGLSPAGFEQPGYCVLRSN